MQRDTLIASEGLAPGARCRQVRFVAVYEHRGQRPLSPRLFMRRLARHGLAAVAIAVGSLLIGMVGYHWLAAMGWVDSFLNAAMILGGMGPIGDLHGTPAKLFAGTYALYAGTIFLVLAGTLLAPVFHRILHRFHWEADQAQASAPHSPRRTDP